MSLPPRLRLFEPSGHLREHRIQRLELLAVAFGNARHQALPGCGEVHLDRAAIFAPGLALDQTQLFAA